MNGWVVETNPDGTFDVRHDRRPVRYDCADLDEAIRVIQQGGGEEFTLIEDDGYRTRHRAGR